MTRCACGKDFSSKPNPKRSLQTHRRHCKNLSATEVEPVLAEAPAGASGSAAAPSSVPPVRPPATVYALVEEATEAELQERRHGGGGDGLQYRLACSVCGGDHDEGACQQQPAPPGGTADGSKGKGKGRKGKGRSRGKSNGNADSSPQESKVVRKCDDYLELDFVKFRGGYLSPRTWRWRKPRAKATP